MEANLVVVDLLYSTAQILDLRSESVNSLRRKTPQIQAEVASFRADIRQRHGHKQLVSPETSTSGNWFDQASQTVQRSELLRKESKNWFVEESSIQRKKNHHTLLLNCCPNTKKRKA
ncbi:hypothetical protein TorRG33x02_197760 [Trema orientale]|uniref:Uncharacterized protein n=1 Tax=Trema orientale TaxID=63057 RepID=A0A2P5EFW9_TREOI|nr:hypothetical protein TorRG33x02_197760 [Trema orientale]